MFTEQTYRYIVAALIYNNYFPDQDKSVEDAQDLLDDLIAGNAEEQLFHALDYLEEIGEIAFREDTSQYVWVNRPLGPLGSVETY